MDLFGDSELDLGRNSESRWLSEMEKSKGKQREKRKMNKKNGNKKKKSRSKNSSLPDLREVFQEVRDKKQLAVRCGKMAGCLHRMKYDIGENCILCRGKWYSPSQFEVIGGKRHNKKWKFSIYYMPSNGFQQVQLLELIKSGVLPEFGHLRESFKQIYCIYSNKTKVTQTDKGSANSVQNMMRRSELMNALKGFPESWKRLFAKTVSIPVCGIEENTLQRETTQLVCYREPQDMEGEPITDTESESESDWDPESSTEYDSLSENDREKKGKRGGKRKIRKRTCKQTGPTSLWTNMIQAKDSSQNLRQTIENKLELPVKCGAKDGVLYVEKYNDMQACIFSEGQWFKPSDFERFGGKARSKKWKNSILYNDIPLRELIKDGLLLPFKKCGVQNKQNDSPESSPVTDRLRKRKYVAQIDSPESSPVTDRLRKRKCKRQLFHSESEESINGSEDGDGDNNDVNDVFDLDDDDDVIDMSVFEGPTLPVTCGSETGILHKYRFAKGHCGRCIRTENFWLTPEDFIRLNKPDGTWRKDIVTNEIPLGKLIMKRVLEPHMINCDCAICEEQDQYLNDDVCFVCHSGGDLVCCDECPRAFHSHCHLPAADGDSLGSKWSCTFCVMKKTEDSSQKTQQEVLSAPVSQYTLHCQYLLLHLLHESMTDPCTNVSGYSENICGPMMLGRVKLNLENNDYQTVQEFVSDIEQIFNNCCTSSGDNDSSRMTSRLKEAFKKEFETVFKVL